MGQAHDFMQALWPELPSGPAIQVWHQDSKRTHYFTTPKGAAEHAEKVTGENVYTAAGLAARALNPGKRRASADEVAGIPGVWADIDVNGGPDQKTGAAPDRETAIALASELLEATVIVNSGYGIQAWWLFDGGPWVFGSHEEREQAKRLVAAYQAALKGKAAVEGFSIDSTFDLARLMRIPGTENMKGTDAGFSPAPVELMEHDGKRHSVEAFAAVVEAYMGEAIEATRKSSGEGVEADVKAAAQPPLDKLELLLQMDPDFEAVWNHRKTAKTRSWSMSQFEMSIANMLVKAGWDDQELADALVYHRNRYEPGDPRGKNRPARIRQTIGKARQAVQVEYFREEAEFERAQAVEQLTAIGEGTVPSTSDRERAVALFTKVIGGPQIKELLQDSRDPDMARFTLVLADAREVPVGPIANLSNQGTFRDRFAVVTSYYPRTVKKSEWEGVVNGLMQGSTVKEGREDTRAARARGWLEGYLNRNLSTDRDAACEALDPFELDGDYCVPLEGLRQWLRKVRSERLDSADIKQYLVAAGFERRTINYHRSSTGRKSSRSYFVAPKEMLDEPVVDEG